MKSFFDGLLRCDDCLHPIADHSGETCATKDCVCIRTRDDIIDVNIAKARQDIADAYKRPKSAVDFQ